MNFAYGFCSTYRKSQKNSDFRMSYILVLLFIYIFIQNILPHPISTDSINYQNHSQREISKFKVPILHEVNWKWKLKDLLMAGPTMGSGLITKHICKKLENISS